MKQKNLVVATATISIFTLGSFVVQSSFAERKNNSNDFDPLFAGGAVCAPARSGTPPLLTKLILAQAKTETAPFKVAQHAEATATTSAPVLFKNLGNLHLKISTTNTKAQAFFDQGLRLTYGFNHGEALRSFRAAQQLDPQCAMCFWGEALVLGPNVNAGMTKDAQAPAAAAAAKALSLATSTSAATPTELALIKALVRRYDVVPPADRAPLDKAYADAMADAARAFPNDDTISVLFAESLMDLSPWDYWEAAGTKPKGRTAELVDVLERVLERNPNHPGAIHYYAHTMEASSHPEKALPYARLVAKQIPGAGHIVHMPAHIYYRVGLYKESLQANLDAIAVDEQYFRQSNSDAIYKGGYYPHNIHFVMVSALMGGDGKAALEAGTKLDKSISAASMKIEKGLQPVKAAPYFAHVQFSTPDTLIALPDPGPDAILVQAMWHYARAIGYARKAMFVESQKEIDVLAAIETGSELLLINSGDMPAADIVHTARAVANGRLADVRGDLAGAIKFYQEAVTVQDALPYTEPPHWYYPVRQSLGAALLRAGRLDEAESAFRASLARTPSNGWALRGLIEVYSQRGDAAALAAAQKRFATTWLGKKGPELSVL